MIYPNGKWGYIYEIKCNKTNKRYVGHTFQSLKDRLNDHKSKGNICSSKKVICNGDYKINSLREYFVYSKFQLKYYEKKFIKLYKKLYGDLCVNQNDLYENYDEYLLINREKILQQQKDYYWKDRIDYTEANELRNQRMIDNWNNTPEHERYSYDPTKPDDFVSDTKVINNSVKFNAEKSMKVKDRLIDIKYKKYFNQMLDLLDVD